MRQLRAIGAVALAAGLLLGIPAAAPAASVAIVGGDEVRATAAAGEDNNLTFARSGPNFLVTDSGVAPTAGAGCALGEGGVLCPAAGIGDLVAILGDLDDEGTVAASVRGSGFDFRILILGDEGNDTLRAGPNAGADLGGDEGNDTLIGGAESDRLLAGDGEDTSSGGPGDDRFDSSPGPDIANGGPGDDLFAEGTTLPNGADTFIGGPGIDELRMQGRESDIRIDADGVADDGSGCPGAGCENDDVRADVEVMQGGRGNDVIAGSGVANQLDGFLGFDTILGGGGADDLLGNEGDDVLRGGPGDDELDGDEGADRAFGDAGDDLFDDAFNSGADSYSGGSGADLALARSNVRQRIDLDGRADDGEFCPGADCENDNFRADIEGLSGGVGPDVLIGNGADNELFGGLSGDRLVGAGGADGLDGGSGADRIKAGGGRDSANGGVGADRIEIRDNARDLAFCGAARDTIVADRSDQLGFDCERVRRR